MHVQLLKAVTLVRKYGHSNVLEQFVRWESKQEIESKFDQVSNELGFREQQAWGLIDPDNRLRQAVLAQSQQQQTGVRTSSVPFRQQRLRGAANHKVYQLLAFAEEEDGEAGDGYVCWASRNGIKMINIGSQVTTSVSGAEKAPHINVLVHDRQGGQGGCVQKGGRGGCFARPLSVCDVSWECVCGTKDRDDCQIYVCGGLAVRSRGNVVHLIAGWKYLRCVLDVLHCVMLTLV